MERYGRRSRFCVGPAFNIIDRVCADRSRAERVVFSARILTGLGLRLSTLMIAPLSRGTSGGTDMFRAFLIGRIATSAASGQALAEGVTGEAKGRLRMPLTQTRRRFLTT